jgi:hypothetical protein
MALNYGVCIGILAVFEQALVGIGYKNASRSISVCGSSGIVFGVIANISYSFILKKTKKYKKTLIAGTRSHIKQPLEIS